MAFTLVTPATVTAESEYTTNTADKAFDGDLTITFWSSDNAATLKWLRADLGSAKKIGRARLHTQGSTNVYQMSLQYSYNDSDWYAVPLGHTYMITTVPATTDAYFPIIEARYWRWIKHGAAVANYHRIYEVELYEDAAETVGRTTTLEAAGEHLIRPNVWLNTSMYSGHTSHFDGSLSTQWVSNGQGAGGVMATLDWGTDVPITKVRWYKADGVNGVVTTWEGSANESDWVTIAAAQASPASGTWTTVDFDPVVRYRYWRWKQDTAVTYPRFNQVEFYTTGAAMTAYLDEVAPASGGGGLLLLGAG